MRHILTIAILLLSIFRPISAKEIYSSDKEAMIHAARVVKHIVLDRSDVVVGLLTVDTGGSTDVSPTQELFFTLYKRGEMFSTDASFRLGYFFNLKSARKVDRGVYRIYLDDYLLPDHKELIYEIDAKKASEEIKKIDCGDEEDCSASENFVSLINFNRISKDLIYEQKTSFPINGLDSNPKQSCYDLWYARNKIFAEHGYCFKGRRAIDTFGRRCFYPYGRLDMKNKVKVDRIKSIERRIGCR